MKIRSLETKSKSSNKQHLTRKSTIKFNV
uniref:Uncharacterized protein n=1 Tax=Rhizophora mucronata TaxID=61149 RepID=A0A2P2PNZ3_RHIMU